MNITTYEKETSPILKEAQALVIKSKEDMTTATVMLSRANKVLDTITEEKEKVTKPLNEALKAERLRWKPLETQLNDVIELLRANISTYQTNAIKAQQKAEEKIAEKVTSGKMSLEKATKNLQALITPDEKVTTDDGSIRFRTTYSVKIIKPQDIPREYLVPDEKRILEALRGGSAVTGCELVETQTPINMR